MHIAVKVDGIAPLIAPSEDEDEDDDEDEEDVD